MVLAWRSAWTRASGGNRLLEGVTGGLRKSTPLRRAEILGQSSDSFLTWTLLRASIMAGSGGRQDTEKGEVGRTWLSAGKRPAFCLRPNGFPRPPISSSPIPKDTKGQGRWEGVVRGSSWAGHQRLHLLLRRSEVPGHLCPPAAPREALWLPSSLSPPPGRCGGEARGSGEA